MGNTNSSENTEIVNRILSIVTNQNLRENLSHERDNVNVSELQETNISADFGDGDEGESQEDHSEGESEGASRREVIDDILASLQNNLHALRIHLSRNASVHDGTEDTSFHDGRGYEWPPVWAR